MDTGHWIQLGILIVLTVTLITVGWYAAETRRQAQATQRIAEASLRPIITQYVGGAVPLRLQTLAILYRNNGNGPAINIKWTLEPSSQTANRVAMGTHDAEGRYVPDAERCTDAIVARYVDTYGNRWRSRLTFLVQGGAFHNGDTEHAASEE